MMRCGAVSFCRVTLLAALCSLSAGLAWGQAVSGSQISGVVKDASGGVLPGASVTATNTDTGLERTAYTTGEGSYALPNLPVGPYKLTVTLEGFTTYVQTGIVLQVNSNPSINVTLGVGAIGEQVNVVAAASMVDTRGTSVGQLIEERQIVNLPLNGRQPTQLILLSGAAVVTTSGGLIGDRRQYPSSVSISVAGGTGNGTSYLVDGGYNNDPLANVSQPFPFPDALQEFKVENGVRNARFGILPGATVNAVTKTGANAFHGALFGFLRDSQFNAIKAFTNTDDGLNRQQWGGTLGGPIVRNKAFFFAGVQVTRLRVSPADTTSFVPSAKMRAGDFTDAASAACNAGNALTLPAPFVNNRVDPALFSPVAQNLLKYLPVSNDPCGRIAFNVSDNSDEQLFVGRTDWQMTTKQRVFARYFLANYDRPALYDGTNLLLSTGNGLGLDNRVQTGVFAHEYTILNNLFSSFRVSFAKSRILRLQGESLFTWKDIGAKITPLDPEPGLAFPVSTITNGYPQTAFPGEFKSMTWQISQDFDWTKGAHQLAFGGMWIRPELDALGPFQANGWYTFNGSRAGGGRLGLADLLLGLPSQYRQGGNQDIQQHLNYVGVYAQDTWRISDKLTLNAGLRWEPYYSAVDQAGYASHFEMAGFYAGTKSTVYTNAPVGLMYPGDPGYPGTSYNRNNLNQFAPRLGVVWDPGGDGKQTVRAAVGIFYEMPKMWQYGRAPLNPPFGNTIVVNNPASFADPWATYAGGDPFPVQMPVPSDVKYPLFGSFVNMPLDVKPTQLRQWNVSYERQFATNWLVSLAYIGNYTAHLWLGKEINPGQYIPGVSTLANTNTRRVLYLSNPAQGQVLRRHPHDRRRRLWGVQRDGHRAEPAVRRQLEPPVELHLEQVHQRRRPRHRHQQLLPGPERPQHESRSLQLGSPVHVQRLRHLAEHGHRRRRLERADQGLAAQRHLCQPQRGVVHAVARDEQRPHGPQQPAPDRRGRPIGLRPDDRQLVQPCRIRHEHTGRVGQCHPGHDPRRRVLQHRHGAVAHVPAVGATEARGPGGSLQRHQSVPAR